MPITNKNIISAILHSSNKWNVNFKYKVKVRIFPEYQFLQLAGNNNIAGFCKISYSWFHYNIEIYIKQNNEVFNQTWVIAHELFHAWQLFNKPRFDEKWLVEGSAEYFAQLISYSVGLKQYNKNFDLEYRTYFNNVKEIVDNIGWQQFLHKYFILNN